MSQAASQGVPVRSGQGPSATGDTSKVELSEIVACVSSDLAKVEGILREELRNDTPFVDRLLEHSWLLGGKRIRPVFVLLAGGAAGGVSAGHHALAAAIELVHTATLVHDDLLDQAKVRRHQETAFSKWGMKTSVLLGDYLFTHAFHVASKGNSIAAVRVMAEASNRVCEGEMWQNAWQNKFDLTEAEYLRVISQKTAELCAASCEVGAILSGVSEAEAQQYRQFGLNLGVAFQIIDDVLDIVGSPEDVGKTLGTDLLNRKPTLPVIHCLSQCQPADYEQLVAELQDPESNLEVILGKLKDSKSIEYAKQMALNHANDAMEFAQSLPQSDYSEAMVLLGRFVLQRSR